MANFCNKCGAPSDGGPFCGRCGASLNAAPTAQPQPPVQPPPPPPTQPAFQPVAPQPVAFQPVPIQAQPQPAAFQPVAVQAQPQAGVQAVTVKKGSPLLKIVVVVLAILFVVGAAAIGGVYYIYYRVKEKVAEVKSEVLNGDSSTTSRSSSGTPGSGTSGASGTQGASGNSASNDACKLLSKEDVGKAIGVEIVSTESNNDDGCSYWAVGTSADMTAKHISQMVASKGADAKSQQMIQQFAGGMGKVFQSEKPGDSPDKDGKVPVLSFSIDTNAAEMQMKLNRSVLGRLGPPDPPIEGVGDDAFSASDGMMFVRKGDKLIRFMYTMCPCNNDAIKPLAKELADRL